MAFFSSCSLTSVLAQGYVYPVERTPVNYNAPTEGKYKILLAQPRQVIKGLGFEIKSDAIGSGNNGLPEKQTSVPHNLVKSERGRFYKDMLKDFRYCRLTGGLYWRGLTNGNRNIIQSQLVCRCQFFRIHALEQLSQIGATIAKQFLIPHEHGRLFTLHDCGKGVPRGKIVSASLVIVVP